jgi:TrmH family RNA methyltransferase
MITSKQNVLIQKVKKLKIKKYREEYGQFIVEGVRNFCDSAALSEPDMVFIAGSPGEYSSPAGTLSAHWEKNTRWEKNTHWVSKQIFSEISDTKTPQGILGVFKIPEFDLAKAGDKILFLNGVSDPGNVGTIFRTALAAGFNTVISDEKCADAFSGKVVRSAMSAVFSLNILRVKSHECVWKMFKPPEWAYFAGGLSDGAVNLFDIKFPEKTVIIIGSEANGADAAIMEKADKIFKIPMQNNIESLNAAVAAAIAMYRCTTLTRLNQL